MCMGVTSADREPERLRDIKTPSVGLSARRTGHYQEKVKEDGDLPRILLDLWNSREEKLVSGCSSVVAMEKTWDWQLFLKYTGHRAKRWGNLLCLIMSSAQLYVPNTSLAALWELQPLKKLSFKENFRSKRNEENFQNKTYLFLHYAAVPFAMLQIQLNLRICRNFDCLNSSFKTQNPLGAEGKRAYENIHTHTPKFLHIYSILNMYRILSSLLKYYLNMK